MLTNVVLTAVTTINPYRQRFRGLAPFFMFNSIQLFALVLLGRLAAGRVSRRFFALPRTTGYVLFGLLVGQSGLNWVALCVATSPAITIATCSDAGVKGERAGLLYTMVAINGAVAFAAVVLLVPFMLDSESMSGFARVIGALGSIIGSIVLGGACAGLVLLGVLSIGLQLMSSIALVLLVSTQMLYSGMDVKLVGMLMATILLMQLFGPLTMQTAIKGFGEATRLRPAVANNGEPAEDNGGSS